jgi:hypothetical protein
MERTGKPNGTFPSGTTTTTGCRRCNSTPRRASQVPTTKVPRKDNTKDRRRTKGLKISPVLSATNAARKATTRETVTPGSSVMNCKDPDRTGHATTKLSEPRRAPISGLWKHPKSWSTTPSQPLCRSDQDEEGTKRMEPGTLPQRQTITT